MKKKLFLVLAIIAILTCMLAISVSAEAPEQYIEFGAKFSESTGYITVYTANAESVSNPKIDFGSGKFYSDVSFDASAEVDMSTAIGIDFSVAKTHGCNGNPPTRMVKPSSPFVNCVEVKWFLAGMPSVSYSGSFFKEWTGLKSFDFGNATSINDNTFEGAGFETITIPASIKKIKNSAFKDCKSLKTVIFEGSLDSIGSSVFFGCEALTAVDLGELTVLGDSMFKSCTALTSIDIPSTVTEIKSSVFHSCTALSSVTMREGITEMGPYTFYKIGGASLHIPASVQSLGYQFAEESGIVSLTFAENSNLTFIDHRAFMNCKSLGGTVILPDGLVEIDYGLFSSCTSLKAVKMPNSVTTLSGDASLFSGCTSLEYVQFSNQITYICRSMFENCSSLKAISLPDSVKRIDYKAFRNCTSLEAVYLPSGLTNLGNVSNSATDWGVFYQSPKVYFVQEPFSVFDGNQLKESFEMPSKPGVYYMPSGLVSVGNSEFQGCNHLNDVIVFPIGVTTLDGCSQGAFFGAGKGRGNEMTLVFLGDMTSIKIRQNDDAYANIHYVFANHNDVDLNSLTLTIGSANNKYLVNSFMYFCAGNVVYDLSTFKAANSTVYTVLETDFTKTIYEDEEFPHLSDPKKTTVTEPDCVTDIIETTYCFCGDLVKATAKDGTKLGHSHTIFKGVTYVDFSKEGNINYECERCGDINSDTTSPQLFECLGFSAPENGACALVLGYRVDRNAIEDYVELTGNSFDYGIFVVAKNKLGTNDVLDASGEATDGVISTSMKSRPFSYFDIKIVGIETDAHKNAEIAMGAYVIVGDGNGTEISYIQDSAPSENAKYSFISYNGYIGSK